jgi:signal transduction histidine kinase
MSLAYQLIYFISAFLIVGISLVLLFHRPRDLMVRLFVALGFMVSGWVMTLYLYYQILDPDFLVHAGRINYAFAELIVYASLLLAYNFPERIKRWPVWQHVIYANVTAVLVLITTLTDLVVREEHIVGVSRTTTYGPLFWAFVVYFALFSSGIVFLLAKKLRHFTGQMRQQLVVFTAGWAAAIAFGGTTNILIPLVFQYYDSQHLGPIGAVIFAACVAYAVIRHELLNIKVVGAEMFFYVLTLFLVTNLALAPTPAHHIIGSLMLAGGLIAGLAMVRSVRREVQRREKLDELAADLGAANQKLRELDELKSEFISVASHQLRTPVSVIKGYLSLIKDGAFGKVEGELKEKLEQIYDMNERLVHLINNLLNISRIEKGTSQYWCSQVNILDVIRRVIAEMSFKAKSKNLTLTLVDPEGLVPQVYVDPERVTEVLVNLTDNAIKYTHAGMVRITVEGQGEGQPVIVRVKDSGIGIDLEDRRHVFQKYYRPHRPTAEHKAGLSLGLGLYICAEFLRSMGGDIWIEETAPGKGTTVAFSLPTGPAGVCLADGDENPTEAAPEETSE